MNPALEDSLKSLIEIDFQLAYVALLTSRGIKPASRWEKPLSDESLHILTNDLSFTVRIVTRTVLTGKKIQETIFSSHAPYVEIYASRCMNKPVDKTPETMRFEGFLFGFPPCCVEQYIKKPYTPNNLEPADQRILFHWACPGCLITPLLLPFYRDAHDYVSKFNGVEQ